VLLATAARAAGPAATTVALRLRESAHADDGQSGAASHGRFRVDVSAHLATRGATSFGLHVGGLEFETPLSGGRFSGEVPGADGPVRVSVSVSGRTLRAVVTGSVARGSGTILAERCLDNAVTEEFPNATPFHGLVPASATVSGETIPLVVGWAGRSAAHETGPDSRTFDVGLTAAAIMPAGRATFPVVVVAPRLAGSGWEGRVSGIAFATAAPPSLSSAVSAGPARAITAEDETSANFGDATTQSPGETLLIVPEGAVFERGFDVLVQAPAGRQGVAVAALGPRGARATVTLEFVPPPAVPPQLLDADFHVVEVRDGGVLWAWGDNSFGEIGDGTFSSPLSPEPLRAPQAVVSVGAGDGYTIVADASGAVWVWGDVGNVSRDGSTDTMVPSPQRVDGLADAVAVSAGPDDSLVLDRTGGVFLWTFDRPHVRRVDGLPAVVAIADGGAGAVALDFGGGVWDLRATDADGNPNPAKIGGLAQVAAIAAGDSDVVFLDADGTVVRRTGDGVSAPIALPSRATSVSAGLDYSMALLDDGTVWAWSGAITVSSVAVRVRNLERVTSIVAGTGDLSFALDSDGFLWKWRSFEVAAGDERPVLAPRAYRAGRVPASGAIAFARARRGR
jgi:hypothetical protein